MGELVIEFRFLDTCRFMAASLDELSSNLLKGGIDSFKYLNKYTTKAERDVIYWDEVSTSKTKNTVLDSDYKLVIDEVEVTTKKPRIKGIYPYTFTDSWDKYEFSGVIERKDFYNSMNNENITDQEYEQFKRVWNSIDDVNLGKYSDLYLKIDILALTDVFETFRDTCLKAYKLDPAHYYTSPGLSWDALLKHTSIELELITDYDMYEFIEKGIRGGISSVLGDRYVKANNYIINPDIAEDDPNQEWLLYVDANNLYGYAMSQFLPTSNFQWCNETQIARITELIKSNSITHEEDIGAILEVDLVVPKTEYFENYPLGPDNKVIPTDKFSEYTKSLDEFEDYKPGGKLILDFTDKRNYVLHLKNLCLYYKLGCKFTILKALMFAQKPWMKSYIDYNTEMRKLATNDFEKDFFKLMNNSVFGKTIESTRKRIDLKLSGTWDKARNHIKKPNFNDISIFTEDLVAIHMHKSEVMLNKPIYVGLAVLELSKVLMYDTYYSEFKRIFRDCKAIYTDCDSLVLHIKDSNIYRIMNNHLDLFDNSDYPTNHVLYNTANKKVLGKFKDELGGNVMTEFVSLRSKSYSFNRFPDNLEVKKHKGVKKHIVKKLITFQNYYDCLFNGETRSYDFEEFKSVNHQLYTIRSNKKGLSNFDSKRLYVNAIENRPFK